MEKCLNSRKNIISRWITVSLFLIMGCILTILAIFALCNSQEDTFSVIICGMLFFIGLAVCGFGLFFQIVQSRKYIITPHGISIYYTKSSKKEYPWTEVSDISVCDINYAAKDHSVFDIVIRIVIGTEKHGPNKKVSLTLGGYDRWRSFEYGLIHFRRVIILDYSEDRLIKIKKASNKNISDYRSERVDIYSKQNNWKKSN